MAPLLDASGLLVVGLLALASYAIRALTPGGALLGFLLGYTTWLAGGLSWFLLLLVTFAATVQATRTGYRLKSLRGMAEKRRGARGWANVLANVGPSSLMALLFLLAPLPLVPLLFSSFLCVALSDTVATELGGLSKAPPRLITRPWRRVPAGTSGGVSGLGLLASLGIAALFALLASSAGVVPFSLGSWLAVFAGGALGSVLDSLLGATLQERFLCPNCGGIVEDRVHCLRLCERKSGVPGFDNNVVNLFAIALGGLISIVLSI